MANLFRTYTSAVKHWYMPLIIGILLIICGIYVATVPLEAYLTLSVLFSVSFIISGLFDIFFSVQNSRSLDGWGWYLVNGILSLAIGIYLVSYPGISVTIPPFVVAFTVMFRSFSLLGFSLDLRDAGVRNWGGLAFTSALGILLAFLLLANPIISGLSLVWVTAAAFIFMGVASVMLSLDLKKIKDFPAKVNSELRSRIQSLQDDINRERTGY